MQLLIVEDSLLDYDLLVATLAVQGVPAVTLRVESATDLRQALASQPWDLVISDHHLPGFSSSDAFAIVSTLPVAPPFIIISGVIGEDAAVEAVHRGADDYLVKGRLARLGVAVRKAVAARAARREQAAAEARLRDSQEQLRNLSTRLQTLIDDERAAIARDIHDEVGGTLTAVKFDLEMLERHLGPDHQRERVRRALAALAQAAQATQRIMFNLRPPILDAGLIAALEWQVDQFRERAGIGVRFSCNVAAVDVSTQVAMTAYRTCQEALTNIIKHAGANQVSVDVHFSAGLLSVEISDNGCGFAPAALRKPGSVGLRGLSERAQAVNGQVDISSAGGRTTLLLWVPLTEQATPSGQEPVP